MIWRVPYPKFPSSIGLARTQAVAEPLGLDLAGFGVEGAVITGSNGKGSTAAMLAAILRETGGPVGLFTSPHLFQLNERFQIDGEEISDADLQTHWMRVAEAVETWRAKTGEEFGGFEFLFLIGADWFAARECRHTVWEAGIGGRYDPVRSIRARRTALTSLDLEHTALLGETLELIAYDKLDAAPAGASVFLGETCAPLRERIEIYAALRDIKPVFIAGKDIGSFVPPLAGQHQRSNTALAIALARDIARDGLKDDAITAGLVKTRWPGRLETIDSDPLIVIDVGHTPDAIRVALDGFASLRGDRPSILVCGASADKNAAAMIAALAPAFAHIICASARHKGAPVAEIAAAAASVNPSAEITIAESVTDARRLALAKARTLNAAIYVAGGLFLAAEFKAAHLGLDPQSLAFF